MQAQIMNDQGGVSGKNTDNLHTAMKHLREAEFSFPLSHRAGSTIVRE